MLRSHTRTALQRLLALATVLATVLGSRPILAATTVVDFGPTATARNVQQIRMRFSDDMAALGNDRAGDPVAVTCSGPDLNVVGHWIDPRNWVGEFARALPDGVACAARPLPMADLKGQPAVMPAQWRFDTGGPRARMEFFHSRLARDRAQEEPVALFVPSVPVDRASLKDLSCRVNGVARPVTVLPDAQAQAVIGRWLGDRSRMAEHQGWLAARCGQGPWPNDAEVAWVWGKGIRSSHGVASALDQDFRLRVRPALQATVQCTAMGGTKGCDPRGPVFLEFSEWMAEPTEQDITLVGGGRRYAMKPMACMAGNCYRFETTGLLVEGERLTPILDKPMRDITGRVIRTLVPRIKPLVVSHLPSYAGMVQQQGVVPWTPGQDASWALALRNTEARVKVRRWHLDGAPDRIDALLALHRIAAQGGLRTVDDVRRTRMFERSTGLIEEIGATAHITHVDQEVIPSSRAMEFAPLPLSGYGTWLIEVDSPRYRERLAADARAVKGSFPWYQNAHDPDSARLALVQLTNLRIEARLSGRHDSLVWITAIDSARPQAGAMVDLRDCRGQQLFAGQTDAQGRVQIPALPVAANCRDATDGLWIVARHGDDVTVLHQRQGLPPAEPERLVAHTILDRALLSAGDMVSMQTVVRLPVAKGWAIPAPQPGKLRIVHESGETVHEAALVFDARGSAVYQWRIPANAKLGTYRFIVSDRDNWELGRGSFQVEEFRLPMFEAHLQGRVNGEGKAPVVDLSARLGFLSGGSAARQSILIKGKYVTGALAPVPGYGFEDGELAPAEPPPFETLQTTLDQTGQYTGRVAVPPTDRPLTLHAEMEFADPNGETHVQPAEVAVWPLAQKVGLAVRRGLVKDSAEFAVIVLDGANQPVPGKEVTVDAAHASYVPGAYGRMRVDAGERIPVCTVRTDRHGKGHCTVPWTAGSGNYWLFRANAQEASRATVTVHDGFFHWGASAEAIELVDQAAPEAGLPVKLRLRSPFLPATALLTLEREGILASHVLKVTEPDQQFELPTEAGFAPGVKLVAQFVRAAGGALGEVEPTAQLVHSGTLDLHFARASHQLDVEVGLGQATARPGETVQARVAVSHRGVKAAGARVTLIAVDDALNLLKPNPTWSLLDTFWRDRYIPMSAAHSSLTWPRAFSFGPMPRYWPARESLLSWTPMAVLDRSGAVGSPPPSAAAPSVQVSAARASQQSSIDRKKVASAVDSIVAGDVGQFPDEARPRTNFSTLALWRTDVRLGQDGRATVAVPLPDSLTRWRIVALATDGADLYGVGSATVQTRKQLQVLSGLPPVVRGGDLLSQKITLRNDSGKAMQVSVRADGEPMADGARDALPGTGLQLQRTLTLPAHQSQVVAWRVRVPPAVERIEWKISARADDIDENDALAVTQHVVDMPVSVRDSTLVHVDRARSVPVAMPKDALPGLGGVAVQWTDSLGAGAVAGARTWMALYPYRCMEQMVSMAAAGGEPAEWRAVMAKLPGYLDANGLVRYFPKTQGSDILTAYVLDISAALQLPLPAREQERMRAALRTALSESRRYEWMGESDLLSYRLALQAALGADMGTVQPVVPADLNALPTIALLDWVRYVLATAEGPLRRSRLESAASSLRNRYDVQGTRLRWRGDQVQQRWWMMWTGDVLSARTALLVQQWAQVDGRWQEDLPRLIQALVDQQKDGHWNTTVANAWGVAALLQFGRGVEGEPVAGTAVATLDTQVAERAWPDPPAVLLPWPTSGSAAALELEHRGSGAPWATVQVKAAVTAREAVAHGLAVGKTVSPVEQRVPGRWSEGDVMKVTLHIESHGDNGWLAIDDPIPSGATILGKGLGGESVLAQRAAQDPKASWWSRPSYIERDSDSYRAYYARVRTGKWTLSYTIRLNNAGTFHFPATRVEAMYAPEIFAESPNSNLEISP